MLFDAGAAEVHVRISSPPIVSPCFYGIDFADEEQLVAAPPHRRAEVQEQIGATSLALHLARGRPGGDDEAPETSSAAPASRGLPDSRARRQTLAKFRFEPVARNGTLSIQLA